MVHLEIHGTEIPPGDKTNKLMATLNDKKDYFFTHA